MQIDKDSAGVRFPPPIAFIATLLAGVVLDRFVWAPGIPLTNYLEHAIGWVSLIAGGAILLTAIGLFRKAGTNPEPWKPVSAFVTDGVYRWTRNPMYLGMALAYAGVALLIDSAVSLVLLIPLIFYIQREAIEREEAYMEAKFGAPYRSYKERVRRWF